MDSSVEKLSIKYIEEIFLSEKLTTEARTF